MITLPPYSQQGSAGGGKLIKLPPIGIPSSVASAPTPSVEAPSTVGGLKQKAVDYAKENLGLISSFIKDPIGSIVNAGKSAVTSYTGSVEKLANEFQNVAQPQNKSTSERIAALVGTGTATAEVFFAPISSVFTAAQQIPLLKPAADLLNVPFALTGKVGQFGADKFVDVLPIPEKDKEIIRPSFEEAGSLAGQVLLGGKILDIVMKKGKVTKADVETAKEEVKNTPPEVIKSVESINTKPTQPENPLLSEARKYKSAEEFVNNRIQIPPKNAKQFGEYKLQEAPFSKYEGGEQFSDVKLVPPKDFQGAQFFVDNNLVEQKIKDIQAGKPIKPIIIQDGRVIDGYHTAQALGRLGYKEFPAVFVEESLTGAKKEWAKQFPKDPFPMDEYLKEIKSSNYPDAKSQLISIWNEANKGMAPPPIDIGPTPTSPEPTTKPGILGRDVNNYFAEQGMKAIPPEDLAGYSPLDLANMKTRIAEILSDYENAKEIGFNKRPLDPTIPRAAFNGALLDKMIAEGDPMAIQDFVNSPLSTRASLVGQELRSTAEYSEGLRLLRAIKDVEATNRENVMKRNKGKDYNKAVEKEVSKVKEEIRKQNKELTGDKFRKFIEGLEC